MNSCTMSWADQVWIVSCQVVAYKPGGGFCCDGLAHLIVRENSLIVGWASPAYTPQ